MLTHDAFGRLKHKHRPKSQIGEDFIVRNMEREEGGEKHVVDFDQGTGAPHAFPWSNNNKNKNDNNNLFSILGLSTLL